MPELETTITEVTVFPDRARVTEQGKVELAAGSHRLEISGLPLVLLPESLRAAGRGTARARLLGVDVAKTYYEEAPAEEIAALEKRIEELADQDKALADQEEVLATKMSSLQALAGEAGTSMARGLAYGKTSLETTKELLSFTQEELDQTAASQREVAVKRRELGKELEVLQAQLADRRSAQPRSRYKATMEVEVEAEGELEVELIYLVTKASWRPLYDLRLSEQGETPRLGVTYLGEVSQNTGQDWGGVALSLSTARPALAATLPELSPWYVDVFRPMPRRQVRRALAPGVAAVPAPPETGVELGLMEEEKERAPEPVEMEAVEAEVTEAGPALTFIAPRPANIPGDGSPHKITLANFGLEPELDYVTAPRLVSHAYRRAKVKNSSEYTLMAGKAAIFHQEEYVGTTPLENIAPGGEFELFLGVDDRLTVEREMVATEVEKRFIGTRRQLRYGYKIEVQNLKAGPEKLLVYDQIPVARHEEIKVKLESARPKPTETDELGISQWQLSLEPGEKRTIRYDFTIEHPRDMSVTGLP
jgi:uncharacterized protein (TIGR02231 family)